jgi:gamma-aminobutyric acid type B receptor
MHFKKFLSLQCKRSVALDALFKQLLAKDNISKAAVIGCGCSVATEPTAEVSHYYNITHVSAWG